MSAAYQNSASGKANAATSITLTAFDCGSGSNRGLAVTLQFANGSSNQPNPSSISVAYNGVALSAITGAAGTSAGNWCYQICYYLPSQPTSTPSDVVASWGNANDVVIAAIAANGVDQTNFVGNGTASSGTSTSPAVTVTGSSGNLSVGLAAGGSGRTLSAATQIERWNQNPSETCAAGSTADGGTVTHQWTQSVSDIWASAGFEFLGIPATAALAGTVTSSITEADIVSGGKTITLTMTADTFVPSALAEITYVGGQTNSFAGTTTDQTVSFGLTGGIAAAPAAGDLVIVSYAVGTAARNPTLIIENTSSVSYTGIGSQQLADDSFDTLLLSAYRFMPSPTETQVRFSSSATGGTGSAQDAGSYTIHVFRGVDPSTPLDGVVVTAATGTNGHAANPPSITPTTAGAFTYHVGAAAMGTGAAFTSGDLTDFRTKAQADTNDVVIGAGYTAWSGSGAVDPSAFGGGGSGTTTDSWAAISCVLKPEATTPFADARSDMISGLDSAQSEASGWDAKVKPNIPVANVVRTSDTVCTITLQAQADYDITAQETITATIPASILTGGIAVVASPTFTVDTGGGGGVTFSPGWAYGATRTIGGAF